MNRFESLPELGVGAVWMDGLAEALAEASAEFDFIEVEPQQHWFRSRSGTFRLDHEAFDAILSLGKPRVIHSVGCPIGGTRSLLHEHAAALRHSIGRLDPAWVSEHLSLNEFELAGREHFAGFLLPPVAVPASVDIAVRNIRAFAACAQRPMLIETGVNYLQPQRGEMPDGAFVAEIARRADCGILLDLHNVWTNERNGRQTVDDFVGELPLERVVEVHLAGGEQLDGYWLDAHGGLTPPELLDIAAGIVPSLPNLKAITFEMMDEAIIAGRCDAAALRAHLRSLRRLWANRGMRRAPTPLPELKPEAEPEPCRWDPAGWERAVGARALRMPVDAPRAEALDGDRGIDLLHNLIEAVRAGTLVDALRLSTRLISIAQGRAALIALFDDYWRLHSPLPFATDEALRFIDFVAAAVRDIPGLADTLALEAAACRALADGTAQDVVLQHPLHELVDAIDHRRLPARGAATGRYRLRIGGEPPPLEWDQTRPREVDQPPPDIPSTIPPLVKASGSSAFAS